MTEKERAKRVWERLRARYPRLRSHLDFRDAWELTAATCLAAQCTDKRVNMVTPAFFARWPNPASLAEAELTEVEDMIRSTGFYKNKAKNLVAAAKRVTEVFHGEVPRTLAELVTLPGVARKTANCVLSGAFGINEGLAVDTHVGRITYRMGLTESRDPIRVERDLLPLFPRKDWGEVNNCMVSFGREVCKAQKPLCEQCEMEDICPQIGTGKTGDKAKG
ncbi:hypothetical protein FACS1894206_00860 [Deltaproteobacteria bacterium]|nr:hypothetical protein FACS1894206_00860 [Deltaproteobacteria bacterium]